MLARISGNFLRAIVNKNPVSTSYSIFDANSSRILKPSRNISITPNNQNAADPCAPRDVYKISPLCPKKGFLFAGDGKPTLKCKSEPAKKVTPKAEQKAQTPPTEKAAKDKKEECKVKECPKPAKPAKEAPKEMKAKESTATECSKKKEKPSTSSNCKKKKGETVKEESCSVLPWPFNLLSKKGKKQSSTTKNKGKGKTKMIAVTDQLSTMPSYPTLSRPLAYPSAHQLSNFIRHFNSSATFRFGPPVCPRPVKPCVLATLPKEIEDMMVRLRATGRANRKIQPESCILLKTGDPCLHPSTGWLTQESSSLMRSPEAMKKKPPRKNFERPPLIARKLRK